MRDIHTRMLGAVLEGEGLRGLAELAAEEAGGPVAILLPARGLAAASAEGVDVEALATVAGRRLRTPGTDLGDEVIAEHPVEAQGETIGSSRARSRFAPPGSPPGRGCSTSRSPTWRAPGCRCTWRAPGRSASIP